MDYLIKSSALIAIFYILYRTLLRRDTLFIEHRWFLIVCLLISVALPWLELTEIEEYSTNGVNAIMQNILPMPSQLATATNSPIFDWSTLLDILYVIGVSFFMLRFVVQLYSFYNLIQSGKHITHEGVTYIRLYNAKSPFSFFKYIFYNPDQFTADELEIILAHETSHVRQGHTLDVLVSEICCAFFWFNPFMWLYKDQIRQNLEFVADRQAQEALQNAQAYQRILLKSSVVNTLNPLVNSFYSSMIKNRIVMLQKSKSQRSNLVKYLLVLPIMAIFLMSFNTKTVYVENGQPSNIVTDTLDYWNVKKFVVNAKTSDGQLETISTRLKEEGVSLIFTDIKRNEQGNLTDLSIAYDTGSSNGSYVVNTTDTFKPISIEYDVTGRKITIGVNESNGLSHTINLEPKRVIIPLNKDSTYFNKEQNTRQIIQQSDSIRLKSSNSNSKTNSNTNVIVRKNNNIVVVDTVYTIGDHKTIWVSDDGNRTKIIATPNSDNVFIHEGNENTENPLIIVDDKVFNGDVNAINSENIETVNVYKGKTATRVYGKAGNKGVIKITTKPENVVMYKLRADGDILSSSGASSTHINKFTDEKSLAEIKTLLKMTSGLKTKTSVKRNGEGLITKLKIRLTDDDGNETSATFKDDDGITDVYFGKQNNQLFIRSGTR